MNSRIKELYTNRDRHNIIHLTEIMKTFLSEHMITDHEKDLKLLQERNF